MGKRGGRGKGKVSRREGPGKAERGGDGQGGSERDCSQRQGQWEWGKPAGSGGFSGRGLDVERACHPPLEPLWFLSQASGWGQGCFCGTHPRPPSLAFASLSRKQHPLGYPQPRAVRGTEAWRVGVSRQPQPCPRVVSSPQQPRDLPLFGW